MAEGRLFGKRFLDIRRQCIETATAEDMVQHCRSEPIGIVLREARLTAQLQHPNTVPVYEIGKDDEENIYFAMKKIEGENLFNILFRIMLMVGAAP